MLIAIAILPLLLSINTKQTWAQELPAPAPAKGIPPAPITAAMGMTYGLGGYKMIDKQMMVPEYAILLKTSEEVNSYKTNDHADKQFKPCRLELNKDNKFEVFYDDDTANEGCTVDFVMDKIDEATKTIITKIKVADEKMTCLEECGNNQLTASSKNIVPFTYSMSNDDFKNLHKGPPYIEDQSSCKDNLDCAKFGGKCMASATSLQLAWNKCAKQKVSARAWIQLVGEAVSDWGAEIKDKSEENPDEAVIQLSIEMGDNPNYPGNNVPFFTVKGPDGIAEKFLHKQFRGVNLYPDCFLNNALPMIPEPQFWTIKSGNAQINGKHLLVFHLLPQTATRTFNEKGQLQDGPAPGMPNCKGKLSIAFENVLGLLQSMPEPTTTQTTTTAVKTTSTASDGTTSDMAATTEEMPMVTNETETTDAPSEGYVLSIVYVLVKISLIIVGMMVATFLAILFIAIMMS